MRAFGLIALLPVASAQSQQPAQDSLGRRWEYDSRLGRYQVEVVATGLGVPFGLAFLPDGRAIVSDRGTNELQLLAVTTGRLTRIEGGPVVFDSVDAGFLDVIVHAEFARNGLIYYAYSEASDSGKTTVVERARLRGNQLSDRQRLLAAYPAVASLNHFGARLTLSGGYLFIALGERDIRELSQELWTHHGKVLRLFEDGRVPPDNPFVGKAGARPEIWSYGHRNPHGLTTHPATGELWSTEHGPLGGDEVNAIKRGANYGWPIVTFGREYEGHVVGEGLHEAPGMEPPIYHYSSSAALSGMAFFMGDGRSPWAGSLFLGAMAPRYLARLTREPNRPVREERLLTEQRWRIRVVTLGPDGYLYLGIERSSARAADGKVVRVRPPR